MDAMKRLGIAPGNVFGSLGDGVVAEALAAAQQGSTSNNGGGGGGGGGGDSKMYQFIKPDALYQPMQGSDHSQRNQFYPFGMANSMPQSQPSVADSVLESLHSNPISSMMNSQSMSQLGTMAHFVQDHMSQVMYQTHQTPSYSGASMHPSAMYGSLAPQWPGNPTSTGSNNAFMLANPRLAFATGGAGGGTSTSDASGMNASRNPHLSTAQGSHGGHQLPGLSQVSVAHSSAPGVSNSPAILGSLSTASLAGLPTQLGMPVPGVSGATPELDPRELEAFAERFKQRRIKLGVTQADVGVALGKLQIPGVGPLSQSTICRFESLTLSHNNMVALKPILEAWLDRAEKEMRERKENADAGGSGKKRKRTSIPAPEKKSLEAYFQLQPRPSGEKIAQIADKLDLKKSVVRVWFCNQRQKQKRMKFAQPGSGAAISAASSDGSSRSSHN